jgi:hypothetical protein
VGPCTLLRASARRRSGGFYGRRAQWPPGERESLTGFDQKEISKREIVLVIKAEIIPTLAERLVKRKENIIREKLQEDLQDINKYKTDQQEE